MNRPLKSFQQFNIQSNKGWESAYSVGNNVGIHLSRGTGSTDARARLLLLHLALVLRGLGVGTLAEEVDERRVDDVRVRLREPEDLLAGPRVDDGKERPRVDRIEALKAASLFRRRSSLEKNITRAALMTSFTLWCVPWKDRAGNIDYRWVQSLTCSHCGKRSWTSWSGE